MDVETHETSENMKQFFKRLLGIKKFVKDSFEVQDKSSVLKEIYTKLDDLIKEDNE